MAKLVLTLVGDDRAGLVQSVAETVSDHGGNWETSELAELAGAFAGIVLVEVPDARRAGLEAALQGLDGLLRVTVYGGSATDVRPGRPLTFSILGNDHPGIVREVTAILAGDGITIETFSSRTREAPMAGGMLFEASVAARVPDSVDILATVARLERLAGEIQVDLSVEA